MATNGETERDISVIKSDISKLRTDLASLLAQVIDAGKQRTSEMTERVVGTSKRALSAAEARIKERPLLSVAITFAVGVLLGAFVDRRLWR